MPGAGGMSADYGSDAYTNAMRMMAMGDILKGGNGAGYYSYMQQMAQAKQADARLAAQQSAAMEQREYQRMMAEEELARQQAAQMAAQGMMADYLGSQMPNPVQPFNNNDPRGDAVAADAMAYVRPEMFPGLSPQAINAAARTDNPAASALVSMFYNMPDDLSDRTRATYSDGTVDFRYNDQEARDWARENAPQYGYGFEGPGGQAQYGAAQSMPTPIAPERMAQIMMSPLIPDEVKDQLMAQFGERELPDPGFNVPTGYMLADPNNPRAGVIPVPGAETSEIDPGFEIPEGYMLADPSNPRAGLMPVPGYDGEESGPDFGKEQDLRKEFRALPAVKAFSEVRDAWGRIQASAQDPSPAGDLAMIFNYMKVLDPGSVVRESEFATAESAAQWLQEAGNSGIDVPLPVAAAIRRMATGQRLSNEQRADFLNRAGLLYNSQAENANAEVEEYRQLADAYGLEPDRIAKVAEYYQIPAERAAQIAAGRGDAALPDMETEQADGPFPITDEAPPTPDGFTQEEWVAAWANMTPEERAEALRIMRGGR